MKIRSKSIASILCLVAFSISGCSTPFGQQLVALQNNPGVQAAETTAIDIGLAAATKSPASAYVGPLIVSSLTAVANKASASSVTGIVANDAPLIVSSITAAIPNSTGKTVAVQIANAYTTAMAAPGVPATPAGGSAVLNAIAAGLNQGAAQVPAAN
jgi:hypothetical protein